MSEPESRLSALVAAELPRNAAGPRPKSWELAPESDLVEAAEIGAADQRPLDRTALAVIVLLWTVQFVYFSLDRLARLPDIEGWRTFAARLFVTAVGMLLSLAVLRLLRLSAGASFLKRALIAIALALLAASLHAVVNMLAFTAALGPGPGAGLSAKDLGLYLPPLIYFFSWIHLAGAVILLSLTYQEELVWRERRLAEVMRESDRARLDALRYQLNPHFLFNALNSSASLISSGRNEEAELMLENLADFLRATLKLDAGEEIPLRDELDLQRLYLNAEQARFPHRLQVEFDVPEELMDVLVPNLITQPLIENSVKHAVAQSTRRVRLKVSARELGGMVCIEVQDDGGNADRSASNGTGVGLQNVANRLRLHFGEEAGFEAGPLPSGGFKTRVALPVRRCR